MFKRKGGGVKGLLNNVQKNCTFFSWRLPWVRAYNRWVVPLKSVNLKNEGFNIGFWFLYNSWVIREWTWRFGCHDQGEIDPIGSFLRAAAQMEETCSNRNYVIFLPSLILVTLITLIMSFYLLGLFCPFLLCYFRTWKNLMKIWFCTTL